MDTALRRAERQLALNPDDPEAREAARVARRRAGRSLFVVEFSANNSGGSWWLDADDWAALARAGWSVDPHRSFVGDVPTRATKSFESWSEDAALRTAKADWEAAVKQDPEAQGCDCCGRPHNFWVEEE